MGIDADEGISETSAQWYENSMDGLLKHLTTKTYGSYMMDTYDEGMENVANISIFQLIYVNTYSGNPYLNNKNLLIDVSSKIIKADIRNKRLGIKVYIQVHTLKKQRVQL